MNPDRRVVVLAVCLVAVLAAGTNLAAAATTGEGTTLTVADATVEETGETQVQVRLNEVPDGLAGFKVTLSLQSGGVAEVTGASYPDTYGLTTDPTVGSDGRQITVEAVDLGNGVKPGASDVTLATINVSGVSAGSTELAVVDARIDDDDGGRVDPSLDPGTVTVEAASGTDTGTSAPGTGTTAPGDGTAPGGDGTSTTADGGTSAETMTPSAPGFGVGVGVVALLAVLLWLYRE